MDPAEMVPHMVVVVAAVMAQKEDPPGAAGLAAVLAVSIMME